MDSIILSPAYGRDYRTAREAEYAFNAGLDWRVHSMMYVGAYTSKRELQEAGIKAVQLRYMRLTYATIVKL